MKPAAIVRTSEGYSVDVFDVDPRQISMIDIAHALSRQNRYGGHGFFENYSVAQHSVLVHALAERYSHASKLTYRERLMLRRQALLHDAAEAYVQDIMRPLKRTMLDFLALEQQIEALIFKKFEVDYPFHPIVKEIDYAICVPEMEALKLQVDPELPSWDLNKFGPFVIVRGWTPNYAKNVFLATWTRLKRGE